MRTNLPYLLRLSGMLVIVAVVAGCATSKPRSVDPYEHFNRKVYAFNNAVDKAVIRPVAVGYRKVTNPPVRRSINDFFTNIRLPISVANDLLQWRPERALSDSARFVVNLTLGLGGFFDPASRMGLPQGSTDFGVTLARWGVPQGPYLMLPFLGPSTGRDVWSIPVDSYYLNPMSIYTRNQSRFTHGQEYIPTALYYVSLRSRAMDAEGFLNSSFDPYVALRSAYLQARVYKIYNGNPPASVINRMEGLDEPGFNPEELLKQQREWEHKQHPQTQTTGHSAAASTPASASSSGPS